MAILLCLAVVLGSEATDTLVLKEKTRLGGRYVRLVELLDADRLNEATRIQIADVYLGRAPEEGQSRTITADDIRKEMERRGLDPNGFVFVGEKIEIDGGADSRMGESLRRSIAFEIKRHLLERQAGLRPEEIVVRIPYMNPDGCPEGYEVAGVKARNAVDWGRAEFVADLVHPTDKKIEIEVIARILKTREVAFAAREIGAGKVLERADVEMKRMETSGDENYLEEMTAVIGSTAQVRIRKGTAVSALDLKLKPLVRKGDHVRAVSAYYEVDARAVEDGAPGAEIAVEIMSTKNRVQAKVIAATRVDVVEGGK